MMNCQNGRAVTKWMMIVVFLPLLLIGMGCSGIDEAVSGPAYSSAGGQDTPGPGRRGEADGRPI